MEGGENFKIAFVNPEGFLRVIDFYSYHDRLNSPPSLGGKKFFLPVNLDTLAWIESVDYDYYEDGEFVRSPFLNTEDEIVDCTDWEMPCREVVFEEFEKEPEPS